jgi:hypothetical protein
MHDVTAPQVGYGYNVEADPTPEDDGTIYQDAMNNFAQSHAANSEAFQTLSSTNASLNTNLASGIQDLQAEMNALTEKLQLLSTSAPAQQPDQWPPQPPPPPMSMPPNPPTYPPAQIHVPHEYTPSSTQYYSKPYQYGRGRGRNAYRGRGYGRHNNAGYSQPPPQQPYNPTQNAYQTQAQYQGYQQQAQGGRIYGQRQRAPYSNITKYYSNWNYCWTHGHDVPNNHDSTNCQHPAPGHMWQATKTTTFGGCTKNAHKTQLPAPRTPRAPNY